MLRIGPLARATGLETKTLRYYDRVGLLRPAARSPAGYRLYDDGAVDSLQFIRRAKALGMSLADIRRILAVRDEGAAPCRHILELVSHNLAGLAVQIGHLKVLRRDLLRLRRRLRERIPPDARLADDCPCFSIIQDFEQSTKVKRERVRSTLAQERRHG